MVKEYSLPGYSGAVLRFNYLGNSINVEFKSTGCKAGTSRFITGNPYIQDAIENDPRYGSGVLLTASYADASCTTPVPRVRNIKKITSVKSINDALRYLSSHGVTLTDSTNVFDEAAKLDVEFVNLPGALMK